MPKIGQFVNYRYSEVLTVVVMIVCVYNETCLALRAFSTEGTAGDEQFNSVVEGPEVGQWSAIPGDTLVKDIIEKDPEASASEDAEPSGGEQNTAEVDHAAPEEPTGDGEPDDSDLPH